MAAVLAAFFGVTAQPIFKMTVICVEFRAAAEGQPRQGGWNATGKTVGNRK
jgi:hypothetical protein